MSRLFDARARSRARSDGNTTVDFEQLLRTCFPRRSASHALTSLAPQVLCANLRFATSTLSSIFRPVDACGTRRAVEMSPARQRDHGTEGLCRRRMPSARRVRRPSAVPPMSANGTSDPSSARERAAIRRGASQPRIQARGSPGERGGRVRARRRRVPRSRRNALDRGVNRAPADAGSMRATAAPRAARDCPPTARGARQRGSAFLRRCALRSDASSCDCAA